MKIKTIYWGHGINLSSKNSLRPAYRFLHRSCDGIILYAEHLKQYVDEKQWQKVSVAPNTLCLGDLPQSPSPDERSAILAKHGISTEKNIIFVGRMRRCKRIDDLFQAHALLRRPDIGVVLVGPDVEGVLPATFPEGVTHIPALYGKELYSLMMACDICCCPGAVGLNIVDAMACGLPFVTEDVVDHGPEIMYLKDGINGAVLPTGRTDLLAETLGLLLDDDARRHGMSEAAYSTYSGDASIERMYQGFAKGLRLVSAWRI